MTVNVFWYQFNTLGVLSPKSPDTSFTAVVLLTLLKLCFLCTTKFVYICIYTFYVWNESKQDPHHLPLNFVPSFSFFQWRPPRRNVSKKVLHSRERVHIPYKDLQRHFSVDGFPFPKVGYVIVPWRSVAGGVSWGAQTKQKSIGKDMHGPLIIGKSQGHLPHHSQPPQKNSKKKTSNK